MKCAVHRALVSGLIACAALPSGAQTVYRCGASYSQVPCEGGRAVAADDARSADSRRQAEASTREAQDTASRLERERLLAEARRPAAVIPAAPKQAEPVAGKATQKKISTKKASKRLDADYFTAAGPAAPKEPKAAPKPKE